MKGASGMSNYKPSIFDVFFHSQTDLNVSDWIKAEKNLTGYINQNGCGCPVFESCLNKNQCIRFYYCFYLSKSKILEH